MRTLPCKASSPADSSFRRNDFPTFVPLPGLEAPMPDQFTDDALYTKGLTVLEDKLGPVQTLRFVALLSRQPFDYQQWRDQHFSGMTASEIVERAEPSRG
jgi:hypothetical protein